MIQLVMAATKLQPTKLGARIRTLREARDWSQSDLSMESKVPQTTLHKIETGKTTSPRTDTLQQIAGALGVSLNQLTATGDGVGGAIPKSDLEVQADRLAREWLSLANPEARTRVVEFLAFERSKEA